MQCEFCNCERIIPFVKNRKEPERLELSVIKQELHLEPYFLPSEWKIILLRKRQIFREIKMQLLC